MMTKNYPRQLDQLERIAPDLAAHVVAGNMTTADALKQVLENKTRPQFDLTIASKKYGKGSTSDPSHQVVWWQVGKNNPERPRTTVTLAGLVARGRLDNYILVGTEVKPNEVIRRFCRWTDRKDAPLQVARAAGATHRDTRNHEVFYQDLRNGSGVLICRWTGQGLTDWQRDHHAYPPEWTERI